MVRRHRVRSHPRRVGRKRTTGVREYVRGKGSRVAPYSGTYSGNPHLSKGFHALAAEKKAEKETSAEIRERIREVQRLREEKRKRAALIKKIQGQEEVRAREGRLERRLFRHATFQPRRRIRQEKRKIGEFFFGTQKQRRKERRFYG